MMLRVIVDTNVAVSALLTPHGNAASILDMVSDGKFRAYYSTEIISEYIDVLSRPRFGFDVRDVESFIGGMRRCGILVKPPASNMPFADESDRVFYDTAIFCDAVLITGNLKHYPAEPFIVAPAEFLGLFEARETKT